MAITKRHIDVQELLGEFLRFTPHAADTDLFRADMRVLNPILLMDSIKECKATKNPDRVAGMAQRAEIYRVYTRKTKELASLYPFVFSVENALRQTAAEFFGEVFCREAWWTIVRDAIDAGHDEEHFRPNAEGKKIINGVPVTHKFIRELFYGLKSMSKSNCAFVRQANVVDEIYLCLSLRSLCNIIESDWILSRSMFVSDASLGGILRKQDVANWFKILVIARNELFHSKPLGDISKVARACECILDKLGFHLGDFDAKLKEAQIRRTPESILRTDRHIIPPP